MSKIFLFGGAFDPPHLGHLQVIKGLLNFGADQVWLVPTAVHDFLKQMSSQEHRVQMLHLLLSTLKSALRDKVQVNTCEFNRPGVSHTIDTLEFLESQYPQHQFSWVIGADNLAKFHLWKDYERLLTEHTFYVYPRKGYRMQPLYTGMIPVTGVKQWRVNSTEIRKIFKTKQGLVLDQALKSRISDKIKQHILESGLYGGS